MAVKSHGDQRGPTVARSGIRVGAAARSVSTQRRARFGIILSGNYPL